MSWYKLSKFKESSESESESESESGSESEDYRGNHTAPVPMGNNSLDNISDVYPDDIYSSNGARYYGHGEPYDISTINIIQSARGRPMLPVKIYRAIPDFSNENGIKSELKELQSLLSYYNKFKFFPVGNEYIRENREKYESEGISVDRGYKYDDIIEKLYNELTDDIDRLSAELQSKKNKVEINVGDWVSLNLRYTKEHGEGQLGGNYIILSKMVRAKDLYTTGDSIHEWGYYPS